MTGNISTLGQNQFLLSRILGLQGQMNALMTQTSSGKKADVFSGISAVSALSLQLNSAQKTTAQYLDNISLAQTRVQPVQTILQQITDLANQVRNDALIASSDALPTAQGNGALKAQAQQAVAQIVALLNTSAGGVFLFGGRDTSQPPMLAFGGVTNAGTILGQAAGVASQTPLTANPASGGQLYEAIAAFLNNGLTKPLIGGGTAPAPFGYTGETGAPGGGDYLASVQITAPAGASAVTIAPGTALPTAGQYVEFGVVPPHNAAYQVTAVDPATRQISFQRVPATAVGLDFAAPVGVAVKFSSPGLVTTVDAPGGVGTDATMSGGAIGTTSISVATAGTYNIGDRIQFSGHPTYYDVTAIDAATGTIRFAQSSGSGGLTASVSAGEGVAIVQGHPPGATVINVGSTTGVAPGMALKFSNSNTIYTVVQVVNGSQLQITTESTASGSGLQDSVPPPISPPVLAGGEITVSFGPQVVPLSVRIDTGMDLHFGIRADTPALRTILTSLVALATTDLNSAAEGGFREIARRAAADLAAGSRMVTEMASQLGVKESTLESVRQKHQDFQVILATQLDRVENVDMADVISRLTMAQTNLQASYQVLALLRQISLVNYLR